MTKFTDSLEEAYEVCKLVLENNPADKAEWDSLFKICRLELYRTRGFKANKKDKKRLDNKKPASV